MRKTNGSNFPVLVKKHQNSMSIVLNRPKTLNSLNHEMVRLIRKAVDEATHDHAIRLSERSPTALMVTLQLLRHNKGRPIEEVLAADLKAARFLLNHPDFLEGVRARLIDKDDQPRWKPDSIETVERIDLGL